MVSGRRSVFKASSSPVVVISIVWLVVLQLIIGNSPSYAFVPVLHQVSWNSPLLWKKAPKAATCRTGDSFLVLLGEQQSISSSSSSIDPIASAQALNDIVPRSKLTPLIQSKSNLQGTLQLAWHAGVFVLAATVHACALSSAHHHQALWSTPLTMMVMAFVSSFFFHGLHETVHRTAFRSKWINDVVAHVFGLLCLRPARHYYHYHWQHHRYTGNASLDSELQSGSFLDLPVNTVQSYFLYLSGIPFWIDAWSSLVRHALRKRHSEMYLKSSQKAQKEVTKEARVYLSIYGLLLASALRYCAIRSILLQYWLFPAILGQPFLRFYLLAEHRGRLQSDFILENTRTIIGTNRWYRKLAWNMPYHMEHHAWPAVPFHKLADARALLVQQAAHHANIQHSNTSTMNDDDLLTRGELIFTGKQVPHKVNKGYIAFNLTFLKSLLRKE